MQDWILTARVHTRCRTQHTRVLLAECACNCVCAVCCRVCAGRQGCAQAADSQGVGGKGAGSTGRAAAHGHRCAAAGARQALLSMDACMHPDCCASTCSCMQEAAQPAQQWQPFKGSCTASCLLCCCVQLEIDTYPWLRRKAVQVRCLGGCCWVCQQEGAACHVNCRVQACRVPVCRALHAPGTASPAMLPACLVEGFCTGTIPEQPQSCLPRTTHTTDLHALGL